MKEYKVELKKTSYYFYYAKANDLQEAEERAFIMQRVKRIILLDQCKKNYGDPNKYEVNKMEELDKYRNMNHIKNYKTYVQH
jgi:hypothetical protein